MRRIEEEEDEEEEVSVNKSSHVCYPWQILSKVKFSVTFFKSPKSLVFFT